MYVYIRCPLSSDLPEPAFSLSIPCAPADLAEPVIQTSGAKDGRTPRTRIEFNKEEEDPLNLPQVFLQNLLSLIPFFQIVLHKYQKKYFLKNIRSPKNIWSQKM